MQNFLSIHIKSLLKSAFLICALTPFIFTPACSCEDKVSTTECSFEIEPQNGGIIDFSSIAVSRERIRSFRIVNTGTIALRDFKFQLSERNGQHYRIVDADQIVVAANSEQTVDVIFKPIVESVNLAATLTITHADIASAQCPAYSLTLDGRSFRNTSSDDAGISDIDGGLLDDAGQNTDAGMFTDSGLFDDAGQNMDGGVEDDAGVNPIGEDAGQTTPPILEPDFSDSMQFVAQGALQEARSHFATVRLSGGDLLIFGGYGENGQTIASIERFSSSTGMSLKVGEMLMPRAEHAALLLESGEVAILGGVHQAGVNAILLTTIELFNPESGETVCAPSQGGCSLADVNSGMGLLQQGRKNPTVAKLHIQNSNTENYIFALGEAAATPRVGLTGAELINFSSQTPLVTSIDAFSQISARIDPQIAVSEMGNIWISGGQDSQVAVLDDSYVFSTADLSIQAFTNQQLALLPRSKGAATWVSEQRVLIAGGIDLQRDLHTTLEEVDLVLSSPTLVDRSNLQLEKRIYGQMNLLDGALVMISGGLKNLAEDANGDLVSVDQSIKAVKSAELLVPFAGENWLLLATENHLADGRLFAQNSYDPQSQELYFLGGTAVYPRIKPISSIERFIVTQNSFEHYGLLAAGSQKVMSANSDSRRLFSFGGLDPHTGALSARVRYYDYDTRFYADAFAMQTARRDFSVTLLADHQTFLIAGGVDANGQSLNSLILYNPYLTEDFEYTLPVALNTARSQHSQTLLNDGRVLLCGGEDAAEVRLKSCEVFSPPSNLQDPNTFDQSTLLLLSDTMQYARLGHSATLLDNGQVFLYGGDQLSQSSANADLFIPTMDALISAGTPVYSRRDHIALSLGNNKVLLVGGEIYLAGLSQTKDAEIYDASLKQFTPVGAMSEARKGGSYLPFSGGKLLVFGGMLFNATTNSEKSLKSSELFTFSGAGGNFSNLDKRMTFSRGYMQQGWFQNWVIAASGLHSLGMVLGGHEDYAPVYFVERYEDITVLSEQ